MVFFLLFFYQILPSWHYYEFFVNKQSSITPTHAREKMGVLKFVFFSPVSLIKSYKKNNTHIKKKSW